MEELFVAILSMLLLVALIPLYLWKRRQDSRSPDEHQEELQVRQRENVVRATGAGRMRRRPAAGASSSRAAEATVEVSTLLVCSTEFDIIVVKAEEVACESRQTKQDRYAEMRRRKDEEREAKERMLEEEAKAQKAKEEEAAALEFEKWKGEFSVAAEGTTENEVQDGNQDLLSEFVEYIKECINRISSLETMGKFYAIPSSLSSCKYVLPFHKRDFEIHETDLSTFLERHLMLDLLFIRATFRCHG
ncbi:hypothetical protein GH714_008265 [Hevea brasiliensis]|uniref:DDRGK domain-containing protein 1 n=1 Tax=Hevea brasiliensis TaxID=3981 RepID=A0A6A6KAF2_HEVBR|nr:hypothetical protein GH714_008265 [Hevea brasiliensis]